MDRQLDDYVEMVVVGGSALIIGYGVSARTSDIDWMSCSLPEEDLKILAQEATNETGLALAVSGAVRGVFTPPDGYEERLREVKGVRTSKLKIIVPEKYDLALSKIAASERGRPHDLDAVELLHQKHHLSLETLVKRFEGEMLNVSLPSPKKIGLTMAKAVARLYGFDEGRKLAERYGVPTPSVKP